MPMHKHTSLLVVYTHVISFTIKIANIQNHNFRFNEIKVGILK